MTVPNFLKECPVTIGYTGCPFYFTLYKKDIVT